MPDPVDPPPPPDACSSGLLNAEAEVFAGVLCQAASRLDFDGHSSKEAPDVKDYQRTATEYAAVLRAAPGEEQARQGLEHACYGLGNRLADRQAWADAVAAYDLALSVALPPPAPSWRHLVFVRRGEALYELGRFAELLAACDETLAEDESELTVHHARFDRALALHGLGRLPEALAAFENVLAHAPGHREARHNREVLAARLAAGPTLS